MSRLTFIILVLLFITVGYIIHLGQTIIADSERNKQELYEVTRKMAQLHQEKIAQTPKDSFLPVKKKLETLTNALFLASGSLDSHQVQNASHLLLEAKRLLSSLEVSGQDSGGVSDVDRLLCEAEKILSSSSVETPPKILAPTFSFPNEQQKAASRGGVYKVERGDNLWRISIAIYHTPWRWHAIWKTNEANLPDYRKMPTGFILKLPS